MVNYFYGLLIALVFVSCGRLPIAEEDQGLAEENGNTPTSTLPKAPDGFPKTDVKIQKSITHLPIETRIDSTCDDAGLTFEYSRAFREGNMEDIWSADQLVLANVEMESTFTQGVPSDCQADAIRPMRTVVASIPAFLTVENGNAGRSRFYLVVGMVKCQYIGGSSVDDPLVPFRANQAQAGMQLDFVGCDDSSIKPGSKLYSKFFALYPSLLTTPRNLTVALKMKVEYPVYSTEEIE
jgi:hypothetical protein